MALEGWKSPRGVARAAYLDSAIKLRDMAAKAHFPEARQALMRLAVFYDALAEYMAAPASARPTDDESPRVGSKAEQENRRRRLRDSGFIQGHPRADQTTPDHPVG